MRKQSAFHPATSVATRRTQDRSSSMSRRGSSQKPRCKRISYESAKGAALAHRPRAALLFFWVELERQVRIEGAIRKVSPKESDAYFASRPHASRLGAW